MVWLCKRLMCGARFTWSPAQKIVKYDTIFPNKNREVVKKDIFIEGTTCPSSCPNCGGTEVEPLEW